MDQGVTHDPLIQRVKSHSTVIAQQQYTLRGIKMQRQDGAFSYFGMGP